VSPVARAWFTRNTLDSKESLASRILALVTGAGVLASGGAASAADVDMYDGSGVTASPVCLVPEHLPDVQYRPAGGQNGRGRVKPDSYLSNLDFALMGPLKRARRLGVAMD